MEDNLSKNALHLVFDADLVPIPRVMLIKNIRSRGKRHVCALDICDVKSFWLECVIHFFCEFFLALINCHLDHAGIASVIS